ncbi:iron transporter [Ensifer adhaerens]|uniref:iron transporter n=1 Tax=Ensifer adhaerens TaxID=106592 RepID=UPI001CF01902|nr:iron transporter [Ensifer adhaerens]UCM18379.1 iron transporter [Ensifer adhaerens]
MLTLLAITFMTAFATSHASAASEGENYRVVDDLAVYLGILPAAMVRGHPKGHPETSMHDGAPGGAHEYHIVVALFEARNGARIENAAVTATVSGLGHVGTKTIELQPMAIAETITYGNFVTLLGTDRYDIQLQISVPGREHPVQIGFEYQHTK